VGPPRYQEAHVVFIRSNIPFLGGIAHRLQVFQTAARARVVGRKESFFCEAKERTGCIPISPEHEGFG